MSMAVRHRAFLMFWRRLALHFVTDFLAHAFRENARFSGLAGQSIQIELGGLRQPTESIQFLEHSPSMRIQVRIQYNSQDSHI